MFAILKASSKAILNGLQMIGDSRSAGSVLSSAEFIASPSLVMLLLWMGFNVSKHITLSKQSSNPSMLRTLATWASSAFEKICNRETISIKERTLMTLQLTFSQIVGNNIQLYGWVCYAKDSSEQGPVSDSDTVISHEQDCEIGKIKFS